jgi:hypothetical protein
VRERVVGHDRAAPHIVHFDRHAVADRDGAAAACIRVGDGGGGGVGGDSKRPGSTSGQSL